MITSKIVLFTQNYPAVKEVKKLASAKARHTGEEESVEVNRLFQKLSVALMRGNAALFNNRAPYQAGDET